MALLSASHQDFSLHARTGRHSSHGFSRRLVCSSARTRRSRMGNRRDGRGGRAHRSSAHQGRPRPFPGPFPAEGSVHRTIPRVARDVSVECRTAWGHVIALDEGLDTTHSWTEAMDLGGTLDSAERAESFRTIARTLTPDMPAVEIPHFSDRYSSVVHTHGDIVLRLQDFWSRVPAGDADLAYVATASPGGLALPLWAFVADGRTTTAFGTPGHEVDEIDQLRPTLILASNDVASHIHAGDRVGSSQPPKCPERHCETAPSRAPSAAMAPFALPVRSAPRRSRIPNLRRNPVEASQRRPP